MKIKDLFKIYEKNKKSRDKNSELFIDSFMTSLYLVPFIFLFLTQLSFYRTVDFTNTTENLRNGPFVDGFWVWLFTLRLFFVPIHRTARRSLMTKAELIAQVAKQAKLSKTSAENAVNAITASITKCLKKKDKISLTGFGTFILTTRRPRKGRNPQTGESIMIGPSRLPRFKPGKQLREACR